MMRHRKRSPKRSVLLTALVATLMVVSGFAPATVAQETPEMPDESLGYHECIRGEAGPFDCHKIDLMSFLVPDDYGGGPSSFYGGPGNDVWGWTDPVTGQEWVLAGRANGTSFVDITNPTQPVFVADLPRHETSSLWSDVKTFDDHAFVVAEGSGNGMQVFDLTRLRDIDYDDAPVTVAADAHYDRFGDSHNLTINEDTGFAYAVGINGGEITCSGELHMIDINDPLNPDFAGCFEDGGSTHDVHCVVYHGPDADHQGSEICFASNNGGGMPQRVTTVDVTDKENPVILSMTSQLEPLVFSHQAWTTDDHRYLLHNDESDNMANRAPGRTRMRVFDISDLDNVTVQAVHHSNTRASAHNLYVDGRFAYLTNYTDGLRVVDLTDIDEPGDEFAPETPAIIDHQGLKEVACFDTDPSRSDIPGFGGSWSNYPYYDRSIVVVNGFDGLFILRTQIGGGHGSGDDSRPDRRDKVSDRAACLPK